MWEYIRNPSGEKFFIYASFRYGLYRFGWYSASSLLSFEKKTKKKCFVKSEASSKKRLNSCKHNADRASSAFLLANDKVQTLLLNTLSPSHSAFLQWRAESRTERHQIFFRDPIMTFDTKFTMALAGCSGSCSANRWHRLSVVLPCFLATNPNTLQGQQSQCIREQTDIASFHKAKKYTAETKSTMKTWSVLMDKVLCDCSTQWSRCTSQLRSSWVAQNHQNQERRLPPSFSVYIVSCTTSVRDMLLILGIYLNISDSILLFSYPPWRLCSVSETALTEVLRATHLSGQSTGNNSSHLFLFLSRTQCLNPV